MEINKILSADLLDILFEGKNKDYGAYELRKKYEKRLGTALLIMAGVALFIFLSAFLASKVKKDEKKSKAKIQEVQLAVVKQEEQQKKIELPPPPPPKQDPPKLEVVKFTPPKIVEDEEVKKEDEVKEQEKLTDNIGKIDQEGIKSDVVIDAPKVEQEKVVQAPVEDDNVPFTKVEIEASFPGGEAKWKTYLLNNLRSDVPGEHGAPEGRYTVIVQFIVDKEGNISDVKALTNHGYGMEEEAIRVIKKGPKWVPAQQNGRQVKAYRNQPITFLVQEG